MDPGSSRPPNRCRFRMAMDALRCLSERDLGALNVLGRANINFRVWKEIREHLESAGMIETYKVRRRTMYRITDKGMDLLRRYQDLREFYYGSPWH